MTTNEYQKYLKKLIRKEEAKMAAIHFKRQFLIWQPYDKGVRNISINELENKYNFKEVR